MNMCHAVPIANAIVTTFWWKKSRSPRLGQLNLMFYGASIFGIVDHLWSGELFLISPDLTKDILKGVVIAASVWGIWGAGLLWERFGRYKALVSASV
jgi:hypothetical protein